MNTENNKLIAEFIGLQRGWWIPQGKPLTEGKKQWYDWDKVMSDRPSVYFDKDLKFHSSWDWLMPVVEKIESLGYYVIIDSLYFSIDTNSYPYKTPVTIWNGEDSKQTKLQMVYNGVVEFITWYSQKK